MTPSRAQSVSDADRDVRQYLIRIAAMLGGELGDTLTALYVYGSLAAGSYHRERSGIDLIAVVSRKLEATERERLSRLLVRLSDERPMPGDIDVWVLQERYARSFEHPMPYEARYDSAAHERIRRGGIDFSRDETSIDLAARVLDARQRGVTLVGPPAASLFGPVPWHAYISALETEFGLARRAVSDDPVYAILNACRVLHGATTPAMHPLSKDEAALWAMQTVPRMYHSIVNDALALYRGNKSADDVVFLERDIIALREFVRERSQPAFLRASDDGEEEE